MRVGSFRSEEAISGDLGETSARVSPGQTACTVDISQDSLWIVSEVIDSSFRRISPRIAPDSISAAAAAAAAAAITKIFFKKMAGGWENSPASIRLEQDFSPEF